MRTLALALATLLVIVSQTAAFAEEVAVTDQMVNPRSVASGKILGAQNYAVDTYGINLALVDGVKPRDVYEIRRNDKKIGEAMVVYVANNYSLLTMRGASSRPRAGDQVTFVRHADMPKEPVKLVHHEPVIVTERNFLSSRQIPSGGFQSTVSFQSSVSFSTPIASFSSSVSFTPSFPTGMTLPTFQLPAGVTVSGPSFGPTLNFGPTTNFSQSPVSPQPSFSFPGATR